MSTIQLNKITTIPFQYNPKLPSSKSMSNRALILHKLSNGRITITNLSEANDTKLLWNLLNSAETILNAEDAGTTARFLTAYCCVVNQNATITGTERMKQRPIKPLVDALSNIGFNIQYTEKEGFVPVQISALEDWKNIKNEVEIEAGISSQFISALMMIAPILPKGLTINLKGNIVSEPYLELTLKMLKQCKVEAKMSNKQIVIPSTLLATTNFEIEADWTNAFYWIALVSLLPKSKILLPHLKLNSIQGDAKAIKFLNLFGVEAEQFPNGVQFKSNGFNFPTNIEVDFNFSSYPDLAQTFIVLCAAKNLRANFTGLSTLKIKETNRVEAMQQELKKCGVELVETKDDYYKLSGSFHLPALPISTYNDHRMAMSFAPLAALGNITIENLEVVQKSYPDFWQQWQRLE